MLVPGALVCREDWGRSPPEEVSHLLFFPVLAPHYSQPDASQVPARAAGEAQTEDSADAAPNVAVVPGLPTGQQTKLPVLAVMVLAWGEPTDEHGVLGFTAIKEQLAYVLAEHVSMALWNCILATRSST